MTNKKTRADRDLQQPLAAEALRALDDLLTTQPAGEVIATERVGAIVRLIVQANEPRL